MDLDVLKTVLPPHALAFDILHYANKIKPLPLSNNKWPLGASGVPQSVRCASKSSGKQKTSGAPKIVLAPSVARSLSDFTKSDSYQTQLNLFSVNEGPVDTLIQDAWKCAIEACSVKGPSGESCHVPVSTVEHENTQLVWGRTSESTGQLVDTCCYGKDCEALRLRASPGPLQR